MISRSSFCFQDGNELAAAVCPGGGKLTLYVTLRLSEETYFNLKLWAHRIVLFSSLRATATVTSGMGSTRGYVLTVSHHRSRRRLFQKFTSISVAHANSFDNRSHHGSTATRNEDAISPEPM